MMPHSEQSGHLAKRQKLDSVSVQPQPKQQSSAIFAPFRTVGLVSATSVPFTSLPLGKTTVQITTSVGRALQTYDLKRGLQLVFVTEPETPHDITATLAWNRTVLAAWGDRSSGQHQGLWVFQRGKKVGELRLPDDVDEPIKQLLAFGSWVVACCRTRVEVWEAASLEHYTTIRTTGSKNGEHEITGGMTNMPTLLNKIFLGRKDGWVEMWNISTGKLIYTIVPPGKNYGSVTCLQPAPALYLLAISYSEGPLVIQNVVTDKPVVCLNAGTPEAPVCSMSFRTDGQGAGQDGTKDGIMATATAASGDITLWDLNSGGRIAGIHRSAHDPPSRDGGLARGGINKIEFLHGQPVIISNGRDNSLKTWIFDKSPFSPIPRILHERSGPAAPVTCLYFLPSEFATIEAGNKWLLTASEDRSLRGWSMHRDGQSTELSQGNIRKKAKKHGILSTAALAHGPMTTLEDLKAPEITCIAASLHRDGGIGALPGKQVIWEKVSRQNRDKPRGKADADISSKTGWESVVTGHKGDPFARTWFWGRKRAGRWMFETSDGAPVSAVAVSPCGSFSLIGSEAGCIDMFNLQSGMHRQQLPSKLTPAQARQVKQQQQRAADDVSRLHSKVSSRFTPGTGRHVGAVTGIVVNHRSSLVITCSLDGKVKFWDLSTGTLMDQVDWMPSVGITACRPYFETDLVAFACDDLSIRVVDIGTKQTVRCFRGFKGPINDFCFASSGRCIIAASQDCAIRTWDLLTGDLIDAMRFETPCRALAMSSRGDFLATAIQGQLGVSVFTNMSFFNKHLPHRKISEDNIAPALLPTVSGKGGRSLIHAVEEEDATPDEGPVVLSDLEQLSADLTTLSFEPESKWQTLLHLDLIKQRNKPKDPPKAPEKAPFFLRSLNGAAPPKPIDDEADAPTDDAGSRLLKYDKARRTGEFQKRLHQGAARGNYDDFIDYLRSLSPSATDFEIRTLNTESIGGKPSDLHMFIEAVTSRFQQNRDYELTQAWISVLLRIHYQDALQHDSVLEVLSKWTEKHERGGLRVNVLGRYGRGVVEFHMNPQG